MTGYDRKTLVGNWFEEQAGGSVFGDQQMKFDGTSTSQSSFVEHEGVRRDVAASTKVKQMGLDRHLLFGHGLKDEEFTETHNTSLSQLMYGQKLNADSALSHKDKHSPLKTENISAKKFTTIDYDEDDPYMTISKASFRNEIDDSNQGPAAGLISGGETMKPQTRKVTEITQQLNDPMFHAQLRH